MLEDDFNEENICCSIRQFRINRINKYRDYKAKKSSLRRGIHNWVYREYPSDELIARWDDSKEGEKDGKDFIFNLSMKIIKMIFGGEK